MIWMTGLQMQQELNIYGQEVNTMANTFQIGLNLFNRGMRCDGDPDDVGLEYPMLIKNLSLGKLGSMVTTRELVPIGSVESIDTIKYGYALGSRVKSDGSVELQKIIDSNFRDLQYYNPTTNTWTTRITSIYTNGEVYMVDFLGKMYTCANAASQFLKWNDENGNGTVAGNYVAKYIEVVENQLFMVVRDLPRIVFWSRPNTDQFYRYSGTCGADADIAGANTVTTTTDVFRTSHVGAYIYNVTDGVYAKVLSYTSATVVTTDTTTSGWDNDTIYVLEDFFVAKSDITALASVNERIAVFDSYNLYIVDIANNQREMFSNRGTLSQRSVAVNDSGDIYWVSPFGYYRKAINGVPEKISNFITNQVDIAGIFDLIDKSDFDIIPGGIVGDDYVTYIYELTDTYEGQTITNFMLCFNMVQNSWRIETVQIPSTQNTDGFPSRIKAFHRTRDENNQPVTYALSAVFNTSMLPSVPEGNGIVYKMAVGSQEDVDWEIIFWNTTLGRPNQEKTFNIDIRYRSSVDFTIELSLEHGAYGSAKTLRAKDDYTTVNLNWGKTAETIGLRIYGTGYVDISSFIINGEVVGHHGKIK